MRATNKKITAARALLAERKLSDKEIAAKVGLSYNCVRQHRTQLGLPAWGKIGAPQIYGDTMVNQIAHLRRRKVTFKRIAEKYGITERTANRLYHTRRVSASRD